ncbi:glycosyltransferase [Patescibacteria group bacterium]|nr:glycosyltransferase [Patescibacteria group bacterium]
MKIAYFTDNYYPQLSGIATSVYQFARSLRKKGHTVYIFAPKIEGYTDREKNVYRLPSIRIFPHLPEGARFPLPIPNKNFRSMLKFNFDIVHAHGNGAFSLLGLAVARAKKIPYVLTFHTQMERFAHYFLKGKVVKPKFINDVFLKRLGNISDSVIAPSQKMKDQLITNNVKKDIKVVPNFVDIDKFSQLEPKKGFLHKRCHIPTSYPLLLAVGRVGKEKNFAFLIETFAKVTQVNKNAHLVIVGPDWGEMKRLKNQAAELDVKSRVHLTGGIDIDQMPNVYADASIFVFPSTSEVHPLVTIEAAVSGLPLIVAKDPAYKGIVINNKNGFVVPLDQDIFARKIIYLLDHPKLCQTMSKNSTRLIRKNLNPEFLTNKLVNFYQDTLKNYKS